MCPPDAGADLAELKNAVPTRERGKNGKNGALPSRDGTSLIKKVCSRCGRGMRELCCASFF